MRDLASGTVLIGSNLVSFSRDTPRQAREDILDALCLAELIAKEKFNQKTMWAKWIHHYQLGLYANGFLLSSALKTNSVTINRIQDLPSAAGSAIQTAGYSQQSISTLNQLARSALDSLLISQHAQLLFRDGARTDRAQSFQVVPCMKNHRGEIDVMVCGMQMTSKAVRSARPGAELTVLIDGGGYRYSKLTYDSHRDRVGLELTKRTELAFHNL